MRIILLADIASFYWTHNDTELDVGNDLTLAAFSCLRVSGDIMIGGLHTWSVRGYILELVNIIDNFNSLLNNE
jgi:hypothetical protein